MDYGYVHRATDTRIDNAQCCQPEHNTTNQHRATRNTQITQRASKVRTGSTQSCPASDKMPSKSTKRAALAKLRENKRKRLEGDDDDLFEVDIKGQEDIYDVVDESEYNSLVNARRQREDFVVDDGKCTVNVVAGMQ